MKAFLVTLFWKQNKWHKHGVLVHTLRVAYEVLKAKQYKMLPAALLHDVGKPLVAFQDEGDKVSGTYSFTNHEEASYEVIKNWPFVSDYTKELVRYHYLIRDMSKSKKKGNDERYREKINIWNNIPKSMQREIETFMKLDDKGKG